jgi:hypothetical protein
MVSVGEAGAGGNGLERSTGGHRMAGFARLGIAIAALAAAALPGCAATTAKTVTTSSAAPAAPPAATSDTSAAPSPQIFRGSGQKDLGTIVVPQDSTISWNCPSCGGDNFIINNAKSDDNTIPTNGLNQTHGVDPIPAGTYHTVVVDTTGGPWTVAIGTTAPTPDSGDSSSSGDGSSATASPAPAGYTQCDANISAKSDTTDCPFAENTFYEYWSNHGASSFSVYSPQTGSSFTVNCGSSGGQVDCSTDQGGDVQFSQSSVDSYTASQAAQYAASHQVGP